MNQEWRFDALHWSTLCAKIFLNFFKKRNYFLEFLNELELVHRSFEQYHEDSFFFVKYKVFELGVREIKNRVTENSTHNNFDFLSDKLYLLGALE